VRAARGKQDDRLEQARLAGRVRAVEQVGTRAELELEGVVAAQVGQEQAFEQGFEPGRNRQVRRGPGAS
jgi:hypothetical protein